MLLRALIVLLVVVNLGVAAWWATRAPPPAPAAPAAPAGVPRLQLLHEMPRPAAPSPVPATPAAPTQCFRFGPYASPAALRRAHARVLPQVLAADSREEASGTASGWRVYMPPLPSRAEAQAIVDRLSAAGIDDLMLVPDGAEANAIALGRYSSESGARRRQAALANAGFTAQVAPLGVDTEGWIHVGAAAGFDPARVAGDIGAATHAPVDCATLDAGG
jgi:hypothetical protein